MNGQHRPGIVLVRQGSIPIVNDQLADVLAQAFPDHTIEDVDVLAALRERRTTAARVMAAAVAEQGADIVRRRTDVKRALLTSRAFSAFARRTVATRIAALPDGPPEFVLQSQSLFAADVPGVPHVVYTDHVHLANLAYPGFDPQRLLSTAFLRREIGLYRRASLVLVRSAHVAELLRSTYGIASERVALVGVGPNAPVAPIDAGERPWHGGRILFVGRDWERKGGPVLLEAFERIRDRYPTAQLDIVGPEIPSTVGARIHHHGRLPAGDVAALLERADVFCLPTTAEPFGVVFIEAMLAGLPAVGTELGAQPDFIRPGETGALVPPGDVDALAGALDHLLADPARTRALGRAAASLAREWYTWPAVAVRMRAAIDAALEGSERSDLRRPAVGSAVSGRSVTAEPLAARTTT